MRKVRICFLLLPLLMSCTAEEVIQNALPGQEDTSVSQSAVYVCLSSEVADTISNTYGFQRLFPDAGEFEQRHREAGLHRWFVAAEGTKADIGRLPGVEYVEETPGIEMCSVDLPFNDPLALQRQWHLYNDGTLVSGFRKGADINVVPVWENYTAGSKDVIVAVIDSGADASHPDLAQSVIPDGKDGSRNFIYDYASTPYVTYPERHGTHTASIIGAVNNNGIGICGIAGGSDGTGGVRILSCQALSNDHSGSTEAALVWAADHGAVIASNSWNYTYSSESDVPSKTPTAIRIAIDYFVKNAGFDAKGNQTGPMAGGVVFFSAGNKQWAKGQPAMYEGVMAVGALGPGGERAYYSNYGNWVDLCAPGGHYEGFRSDLAMIYGCVSGGGYYQMQGTSQACPMASGVAALLVSYFGGPGFTNEMLKERLLGGADGSVSCDKPIGPGLDAYGAFIYTKNPPPQVSDFSLSADKRNLSVKWKVQDHDGLPTSGYYVAVGKNREQVTGFNPLNIPKEVLVNRVNASSKRVGDDISSLFYRLDNHSTYYCTIVSIGRNGLYSPPAQTKDIIIYVNTPPEIVKSFENITTFVGGKDSFKLDEYFRDPDNETLTYTASSSAETVSASVSGNDLSISGNSCGNATVTVTATDPGGKNAQTEFHVKVQDSEVNIYPNPVHDKLFISILGSGNGSVTIRNPYGKQIFSKTIVSDPLNPYYVDMSSCPNGTYAVSVVFNGKETVKQIVKY